MIQPGDYLKEREAILCRTELQQGNTGETLVCTDARLVHFSESQVTDIQLESIDVIEYNRTAPPLGEALAGLAATLFGAFLVANPQSLGKLGREFGSLVGFAGLVLVGLGIVALGRALLNYGSEMVVHTPSGSFSFESTAEMEQFAHAVRGATS